MSRLQQLNEGMSHAWDTLVDGWRHLYHRAADAITRFRPGATDATREETDGHVQRSSGWGVLAAEVFDGDHSVVVRLEIPGMDAAGFQLEATGRQLLVSGEKTIHREHSQGRYHVSECAYGRFERLIGLPADVDASRAEASYKRGVLRIEIPKLATSTRRRIKVQIH